MIDNKKKEKVERERRTKEWNEKSKRTSVNPL